MDQYISGEGIEVIKEAMVQVRETWPPFNKTANPCGVYSAKAVQKIAEDDLTICHPSAGCGVRRSSF